MLTFLGSFGAIQLTLGGMATPRHVYSEKMEAIAVAALTAFLLAICTYLLNFMWRFPVPFSMLILAAPWGASLIVTHLILYRKFKRHPGLLPSLRRHAIPLAIQSSQFFVYAGLTVLFDRLNTLY